MTLNELLKILKEHLTLCIVLPLACVLGVVVLGFVTPESYVANTSIYVLMQQDANTNVTNSDLSASQMVANDVANIMQGEQVRDRVAAKAGLKNLSGYKIAVESSMQSRVINISVKGEDPAVAKNIANSLVQVTNEITHDSMDIPGVRSMGDTLVDVAPNIVKSLKGKVLALFGGFFIAVILAVLQETLNTSVRTKEEIIDLINVPVIGRIPSAGGR